ncbi:MAG: CoA transferase [Candidatus Tectomicrobia bacterium]|nr:CoA transferase [Candidatus Tectomicrobia bacterium]
MVPDTRHDLPEQTEESLDQPLLEGIRILDLSRMLAGPYGSLLLADMGAEVLKIEDPGVGDKTRTGFPLLYEGESIYFLSLNRNKKSLTLNMKDARGRDLFAQLVKQADVVYDNMRPDALKRLGADYETLRQLNPRIISCSVTGFGHTGPYRDHPAFDLIVQGMGGAMSYTGPIDGEPVKMGLPMGDLAAGMFGALAVCAALFRRERSGYGQRIDISMLDGQMSLHTYIGGSWLLAQDIARPFGSAHQYMVPYQAFKTADSYIVVVTSVEERFWANFCRAVGLEELAEEPRFLTNQQRGAHRDELIPLLEERFLAKTSEEWLARLNEADVPCGPVNTIDRAFQEPQVLARNMVVDVPHPRSGTVMKVIGNPIKVSAQKTERFVCAPSLGEHTESILTSLLGYSAEQVAALRREGVV